MYRSRVDGVGAVSWFSDIVNEQIVIDAAPVVHGRWKFNNKTLEYRCQQIIDGKQCNGSMHYPSDYCPDCGTKMDLEGR